MNTVEITSLEEPDRELVSALMTVSLIEEYGEPPDSINLNELLEFYYNRPDSKIYCLRVNQEFAGFTWLIESSDVITGKAFVCVLYLAVKPEFRGNGYSRLLLDKAKESCRQKNIAELRLSVRYDNDRALKLYNSIGFRTYKHEMLLELG